MLNSPTNYSDSGVPAADVPLVRGREARRPSQGLSRSRDKAPASVEQVVARHTATKAHRQLNAAYASQSLRTGLPLLMVDIAVTAAIYVASVAVASQIIGTNVHYGVWLQLPVLMLLQIGLLSLHQLYPGSGTGPVEELRGIVRSTSLAFMMLSAINLIFGQLAKLEMGIFVASAFLISLALPFARYVARDLLSRTKWWGIRTLFIGARADCERMMQRLGSCRSSGYIPVESACLPESSATSQPQDEWQVTSDAFALGTRCKAPVATLVSPQTPELAERLTLKFPSVVWIDFQAASQVNAEASDLLGTFARRMSMPLLRFTPRAIKRCVDLAICIPVLLVLSIPMAIVAICIKIVSPGPVIYGSRRIGQHGKEFRMWKFRSMVVDADQVLKERLASDPEARAEWDRDAKLKSDPRILPRIGSFIRRYSVDELPQLWNVLTGEMSIVGPRPLPPDEIVRYQNHYYEYTKMWPGMTGLWQVSGRNETSFSTRVFLVRHYATNWSLWLDAWILAKTPIVVIAKRGAY